MHSTLSVQIEQLQPNQTWLRRKASCFKQTTYTPQTGPLVKLCYVAGSPKQNLVNFALILPFLSSVVPFSHTRFWKWHEWHKSHVIRLSPYSSPSKGPPCSLVSLGKPPDTLHHSAQLALQSEWTYRVAGGLVKVARPAPPVCRGYCYLYLNSHLETKKIDKIDHVSSYFV